MMNALVYRAVKPAARLMDMLRFPMKLLLIALIFVVPAVILAGYLTTQLNEDRLFVGTERIGVKALPALQQLASNLRVRAAQLAIKRAGDSEAQGAAPPIGLSPEASR